MAGFEQCWQHQKMSKKSTKKGAAKSKKKIVEEEKEPKKKFEGRSRPLSAYMFFVKQNRVDFKNHYPEATFGELGKLLGAAWEELTPRERKRFEEMAEKDKRRFAE